MQNHTFSAMRHIITSLVLVCLWIFPIFATAADFTITLYNDDHPGVNSAYKVSTVRSFYSNDISIPNVSPGKNASVTWNVVEGNQASVRLGIFDEKNNAVARIVFMAEAVSEPILVRTSLIENYHPTAYIVTADPPADLRLKDMHTLYIRVKRK